MSAAVARLMNAGRRLHLQHGPIDLIIEASGEQSALEQAYQQAINRFSTVLTELVAELPQLRSPVNRKVCHVNSVIARRMWRSASSLDGDFFCTPMICVAGSVADEILQAMLDGLHLQQAYVNNGGDIALALMPGQSFNVGVVTDLHNTVSVQGLPATVKITADDGIGGIASSGRHGRSLSLGIADVVTVLAENASMADTAATLIANAVDLPHSKRIVRAPAYEIDPDSDLGERQVTVDVLPLSSDEINTALCAGQAFANTLVQQGLICGAWLALQGQHRSVKDQTTGIVPGFKNSQGELSYA